MYSGFGDIFRQKIAHYRLKSTSSLAGESEPNTGSSNGKMTLENEQSSDCAPWYSRWMTKGAVIGTVVGVGTAVVATPLVIGALGYGAGGIAGGSYAASMMSSAAIAKGGGVAAGSLVATLQSVGAAGLGAAGTMGAAAAGATGGAALGTGTGALVDGVKQRWWRKSTENKVAGDCCDKEVTESVTMVKRPGCIILCKDYDPNSKVDKGPRISFSRSNL